MANVASCSVFNDTFRLEIVKSVDAINLSPLCIAIGLLSGDFCLCRFLTNGAVSQDLSSLSITTVFS